MKVGCMSQTRNESGSHRKTKIITARDMTIKEKQFYKRRKISKFPRQFKRRERILGNP